MYENRPKVRFFKEEIAYGKQSRKNTGKSQEGL